MNKRFEISNINKMIDRLQQINKLYLELSEETRANFNNSFDYGYKPQILFHNLDIVLNDLLNIRREV